MKIRTRLTLYFTVSFTIVYIIFAIGYAFYLKKVILSFVDKQLLMTNEGVLKFSGISDLKSIEELKSFTFSMPNLKGADKEFYKYFDFIIYDKNKNLIKKMRDEIDYSFEKDQVKFNMEYYNIVVDSNNTIFTNMTGDTYLILRAKINQFKLGNDTLYVMTILPINYEMHYMITFRNRFLSGLLVTIIILFFTGIFFISIMLSSINKITRNINTISPHELDKRLIVKNKSDEIGTLTIAINGLFDRIERALNLEKQFVSDVSHEFKTPLTGLRLSLERLVNSPNLNDEESYQLGLSIESLYSMDFLVKKLLYLSKLEEGNYPFHPEKVNLIEILEKVYNNLIIIADDKKISFKMSHEMNEILINADDELLYIALYNIVENAIKYTDHGAVLILLNTYHNRIVISVEDTGIGILNDKLDDIFEKFYRIDTSRSKTQGYGIGLSISKRIIDLHNGKIVIESIPSLKTCFNIELPVDESNKYISQ
ncbi:MAG: hypothetical protein A2015_09610 [Spirochaetes bacterium GWF1_31_7]|nr:MAG: hypothetical protein A2Y30_00875 [Spirochaetes bacterium GWE1_32_154]OHD45965.1 MAG: hypothetical protein A2Y29_16720 [Spirochaetes bacterium GWE2_31_10]OHD52619.1 MAG: hypothetical protein A2015_09610 [Spirochaetes bacterium GWF1_31_7]HBD95833.1 hypothetical protein [Spirochaetia bacterium]HBI37146.1 hypothetical protein [Spirochaetia bacterium]